MQKKGFSPTKKCYFCTVKRNRNMRKKSNLKTAGLFDRTIFVQGILLTVMLFVSPCVMAQEEGGRTVAGDTSSSEFVYQAPRVNPLRLFGSPFCEHFGEVKYSLGRGGLGIGFGYTYLPELWGFHLMGYLSDRSFTCMAGAGYRLSRPWQDIDWQLYGGVGLRYRDYMNGELRPAAEVGVRVAGDNPYGKFCMTSGTLGLMTDGRQVYLTVGFGITICVVASSLLMLGI